MRKNSPQPGRVFDKLTLIREVLKKDEPNHLRRYWECLCECGKKTTKREDTLYKRKHQSCGCDTSKLQADNTRRLKWQGCGQFGKTFFTACQRSAQKREINFGITIEDAWEQYEKQKGVCALSNVSINLGGNTPSGRKETTASLDRIDSAQGYTKDNIQWVHKTINLMKNVLSQDEFIQWCNKVSTNHNEQST